MACSSRARYPGLLDAYRHLHSGKGGSWTIGTRTKINPGRVGAGLENSKEDVRQARIDLSLPRLPVPGWKAGVVRRACNVVPNKPRGQKGYYCGSDHCPVILYLTAE